MFGMTALMCLIEIEIIRAILDHKDLSEKVVLIYGDSLLHFLKIDINPVYMWLRSSVRVRVRVSS